MSPNVGNFVHDLVEMAKAMETLPQVERDRDEAVKRVNELSETIAERETRIIDLKVAIEALHNRLNRVEAERDDAEIRFLELDERAHKVLDDFEAVATLLAAAKRELDPPKPEPAPVVSETMAVHSAEPVPGVTVRTIDPFTQLGSSEWINGVYGASLGQSEPDPTATSVMEHGQQAVGQTQSGVVQPTTSSSGPYHGKLYVNTPGWVSREDWLAGGGTIATYDWREGYSLPDNFYYGTNGPYYVDPF